MLNYKYAQIDLVIGFPCNNSNDAMPHTISQSSRIDSSDLRSEINNPSPLPPLPVGEGKFLILAT
jgi:hypothetical protein